MLRLGFALVVLLAAARADSSVCAGCHRDISESYGKTGMGRSFYRLRPENVVEDFSRRNSFYHQASDRHYTMQERRGRYYQRRHQLGPDGRERNVVEKEIHFVMGSGNHSRTYLHQTASGELVQLPVGWFAERGGFWAMNPGYDRPDHMDFRRKIDSECFFCHNAYPEGASGGRELKLRGDVPEGIDCERCHGPAGSHVQLAKTGAAASAVRRAVVNPARLSAERQLEVCLQCHLESTSHRLPYSIRRFGRGYFSYRPGEPLADYILHFDRERKDDRFEIAHAGYRMMESACFLKSSGKLTCTTCHNPHEAAHGRPDAESCRQCHAARLETMVRHPRSEDCAGCHMPKRRTGDAVNVVMTDHKIARHKPAGDLVAARREVHDTEENSYKGEVVLLYPRQAGGAELYLDLAQVLDGANLVEGIPRLEKSVARLRPPQAEFYAELANAYVRAGRSDRAIPWYQEALRRRPDYSEARVRFAAALAAPDAVKLLEAGGSDPALLNALGSAYTGVGRFADAIAVLRRAAAADPDVPEVHVNLGAALSRNGEPASAIEALRTAIRLAPDLAAAHNNLANLLSERGEFALAKESFEEALRLQPGFADAHYNYGRALAGAGKSAEAERELQAALRLRPKFAAAAVSLGMLQARAGRLDEAAALYRRALRDEPLMAAARYNLGLALMGLGKTTEAKAQFAALVKASANDYEAHYRLGMILMGERETAAAASHLREAMKSPDAKLREAAGKALAGK